MNQTHHHAASIRMRRSLRGAGLTGYGLVVGLIAVVAIAATTGVGGSVTTLFTDVGGKMDDVVQETVPQPSASPSASASASAPSCSLVRASCQAHLDAGCSSDGAYAIDADGSGSSFAEKQLWCDMTSDEGGWTLVFKESDASGLTQLTAVEQGNPGTCLSHLAENCDSKLSDSELNAIGGTGSGDEIGYRITSPDISPRYYFPNLCSYTHSNTSGSANPCNRVRSSYSADSSPAYLQCNNWGGHGGGLNAWYQCNGGGYTNMAVTHRSAGYPEQSGITTNTSGVNSGTSNSTFGNSVYMWVR